MKPKIAKGQEKYIIKIIELAKQEERVRILNLIDEYLNKGDRITNRDLRELKQKIQGEDLIK